MIGWCRPLVTRGLAALPDRRGVKWLIRQQDRVYYFTLGVIKVTEGANHPRHRLTDARAFFAAHVDEGDRVLDVGAAYGHNAVAVAERGGRVVALEIRPDAVERARRERPHPAVDYRVGTLGDLASDERFDVILLGNVLEHIEDRAAFLTVCRDRGRRLLVRVPAVDRDWMVAYRQELGLPWKLHPDHHVEYTVDSLTQELEHAAFRVTTCYSRFGAIHAVAEARS